MDSYQSKVHLAIQNLVYAITVETSAVRDSFLKDAELAIRQARAELK